LHRARSRFASACTRAPPSSHRKATIRYAIENEATRLLVKSDSRTVVHQINGKWRCTKPHLADYLKQVHEATEGMDFQIELIPRKENKMADKLTWLERE
jgi:ribonuclease HI